MLDTFVQLLPELGVAVGQTFLMLGIALAASILLGGPLGVLVFLTGPGQSLDRPLAVSYTHLDVYKRQRSRRAASISCRSA